MDSGKYSVYSDFDIQKHKETFIHYLEVVIDENGKIMYAVPSHTLKIEKIAAEKMGFSTQKELHDACPPNRYGDYFEWLTEKAGAIAVWEGMHAGHSVNKKQLAALRSLKMAGLYLGALPDFHSGKK